MWFLKLFVLLLLKTPFIQSNESKFSIKELHHELRGVPEAANNLFLESQVLNGDVSAMDLLGELFDGKLDVKLFKKYREIDYSNGIDEQIKMLELSEKAEKVKVTEEVRKSVRDGFETLESMKDPIPGFEEDREVMWQGIINVWNITQKMAGLDYSRHHAVWLPLTSLEDVVKSVDELLGIPLNKKNYRHWRMGKLKDDMIKMKEYIRLAAPYIDECEIMDEVPSIDYLRNFERFINEEKENLKKIRESKDVIPKLPLIMNETKIMVELRDSQVAERIPDIMKQLEDDTNSIIEIEMSESVASKYHAIKSLSGIMGTISELNSQLQKVQRKSPYLLKRSTQLLILKKNVEEFESLRGTVETSYKKFRQLVKEFRELYNVIYYFDKLDFSGAFENSEDKDFNEVLKKTVHTVDKDMLDKARNLGSGKKARMEVIVTEINQILQSNDFKKLEKVTVSLHWTFGYFGELVKCYSDLKVDVSEVKSLIDMPEETWNVDLRKLENIAEIKFLFYNVDKAIEKLKNWKYVTKTH
ncbi:unnamed protein product [Caenorhabditis brenneri]